MYFTHFRLVAFRTQDHLQLVANSSTIAAPVDWVETVGNLRFPSKTDRRLQELMDRNGEGRPQCKDGRLRIEF